MESWLLARSPPRVPQPLLLALKASLLTPSAVRSVCLLPLLMRCLCPLQKDLLEIQLLLNSSETSLHQLTAMLDCRGLHKVLG